MTKNTLTIEERINKLDEERERLYNIKDVIEVLEREQRWLKDPLKNEDGTYQLDENGENILVEPSKESWGYARYMIYEELKQYLLK